MLLLSFLSHFAVKPGKATSGAPGTRASSLTPAISIVAAAVLRSSRSRRRGPRSQPLLPSSLLSRVPAARLESGGAVWSPPSTSHPCSLALAHAANKYPAVRTPSSSPLRPKFPSPNP